MLKNYLTIAFRNIIRQKAYSIINIMGLAIALSICFIILVFVQDELSYDKFHDKADRIYRVIYGNDSYITGTPYPLAPILKEDFPDISTTVRINATSALIRKGDYWLDENRILCVDKPFFEVFTFPLTKGNSASVLNDPMSVVITTEMAQKYFGNEEPIGKTLTLKIENDLYDLKVTGVAKVFPKNSQFKADFIASIALTEAIYKKLEQSWSVRYGVPISILQGWDASILETFVLLPESSNVSAIEQRSPDFNQKHFGTDKKFDFHLQPLTDIHLSTKARGDNEGNSRLSNIYLFSIIAFLLLAVASINFVILTTARSSNRAKEIGLRKVVGANRSDLIKQIIGESILTALIALPIAIVLVELIRPYVFQVLGKELAINYFKNWQSILGFFIITISVGILSGSYIAVYLSRFQPTDIFRKMASKRNSKSYFRKGLIIVQLFVFIFLLTCTVLFNRQLNYLHKKDLGFKIDNLISFDISNAEFRKNFQTFKQEIKSNSQVLSVSAALDVPPTESGTSIKVSPIGHPEIKLELKWQFIDYDYFNTLGVKLIEGREFSDLYPNEELSSVVLNESAIKELGLKEPIGKTLRSENVDRPLKIVGMIQDFHEGSLRDKIPAIVFSYVPEQLQQVVIRLQSNDINGTVAFIKNKWSQFNPGETLEVNFIKEKYDQFYQVEERLGQVIGALTLLTIFVACLGLMGLSMFMAEQRTKEIGVRKVLGASVKNIIQLLTEEFAWWVFVANLIALPIAWFVISKWLQNFAYHTSLTIWPFLFAGFATIIITLLTVSWQAIQAATANPMESLKYE
jgi:putative ABC transport system permease protein